MSKPVDQAEVHVKKKKGWLRGCLIAIVGWIAIITVIAFIVVKLDPTYTELEGTAAPLIKALQAYNSDHGAYPANIEVLIPKYISAIPACPGKKRPIPYFKEKDSNQYELICYGFFTHKLRYRSITGKWDSYD